MTARRALLTALAGFAITAPAAGQPATAKCAGSDLLEKLRTENPNAHAELSERAKSVKNGRAIFWRIDPPGGGDPSWLFGTVHISDPRVHDLPQPVREAFAKSKSVALEMSGLSNPQTYASQLVGVRHMFMMPQSETLRDHLTEQQIEQMVALKPFSNTMHVETLVRMQPWFLWLALSIPSCELANQAAGKPSLDARLEKDALAAGKSVIGLETLRGQFEILSGLDMRIQLEGLRATLKMSNQLEDIMTTTVNLYLARRMDLMMPVIARLSDETGFSRDDLNAFYGALLDRRNVTQFNSALRLVDQGHAFIAVGAMHLPGEKGLVAMFEKAGYKLTAIY